MRIVYDSDTDAAYVSLIPSPCEGGVNTLVGPVAELPEINLDFNISALYRFIGIEIFNASHTLPATFLQERCMTLTFWTQTRLAYLSLVPGRSQATQRRLLFQDRDDPNIGPFRIAFDLGESHRLIGVEVQDADRWLTEESLKGAETIDG